MSDGTTSTTPSDTSAAQSAAWASQNATAAAASAAAAAASSATGAASATAATQSAATAAATVLAAQTAATALNDAVESFGALWVGQSETPPTLDRNGNALMVGAVYEDTSQTPPVLMIYTSSGWVDSNSVGDSGAGGAEANAAASAAAAASSASAASGSAGAASTSATASAASASAAQTSKLAAAASASTASTAQTATAASAAAAVVSQTAAANSATAAAASAASVTAVNQQANDQFRSVGNLLNYPEVLANWASSTGSVISQANYSVMKGTEGFDDTWIPDDSIFEELGQDFLITKVVSPSAGIQSNASLRLVVAQLYPGRNMAFTHWMAYKSANGNQVAGGSLNLTPGYDVLYDTRVVRPVNTFTKSVGKGALADIAGTEQVFEATFSIIGDVMYIAGPMLNLDQPAPYSPVPGLFIDSPLMPDALTACKTEGEVWADPTTGALYKYSADAQPASTNAASGITVAKIDGGRVGVTPDIFYQLVGIDGGAP